MSSKFWDKCYNAREFKHMVSFFKQLPEWGVEWGFFVALFALGGHMDFFEWALMMLLDMFRGRGYDRQKAISEMQDKRVNEILEMLKRLKEYKDKRNRAEKMKSAFEEEVKKPCQNVSLLIEKARKGENGTYFEDGEYSSWSYHKINTDWGALVDDKNHMEFVVTTATDGGGQRFGSSYIDTYVAGRSDAKSINAITREHKVYNSQGQEIGFIAHDRGICSSDSFSHVVSLYVYKHLKPDKHVKELIESGDICFPEVVVEFLLSIPEEYEVQKVPFYHVNKSTLAKPLFYGVPHTLVRVGDACIVWRNIGSHDDSTQYHALPDFGFQYDESQQTGHSLSIHYGYTVYIHPKTKFKYNPYSQTYNSSPSRQCQFLHLSFADIPFLKHLLSLFPSDADIRLYKATTEGKSVGLWNFVGGNMGYCSGSSSGFDASQIESSTLSVSPNRISVSYSLTTSYTVEGKASTTTVTYEVIYILSKSIRKRVFYPKKRQIRKRRRKVIC